MADSGVMKQAEEPDRKTRDLPRYALPFLAICAGVASTFVAQGLLQVIRGSTWIFYSLIGAHLSFLGRGYLVVIPVLGAVLYAPITRLMKPQERAHGLPEVIYAVRRRGGRMRVFNLVLDLLASVISIGSGGSVGQEGPVVEAGSAAASAASQVLKLPADLSRLLIACGAAGAVAATFDAPLTGAFFANEIVLRSLSVRSLIATLLSAVTANLAARSIFALPHLFPVGPFVWSTPVQVPLYLLLGLLAGVAAIMTVEGLHRAIALFERWRIPFRGKAILGAGLVGSLGVAVPRDANNLPSAILGVGTPVVRATVQGHTFDIKNAFLLGMAKLIAFWLSIGSGGAGGVLGPSVFGGVMLGSLFGGVAHTLVPAAGNSQSGFAIAGMVALFGGAAQAPLTAVAMAWELTGQPSMLAPAACSVAAAYALARRFERLTIYTIRLSQDSDEGTATEFQPEAHAWP